MWYLKDKKLFLLAITSFLVLPETALADIPTTWFEEAIQFSPIIYFSEAVYFWFYTNRLLNRPIEFKKILLTICIANVVTTLLGISESGRIDIDPARMIGLALIFSALIEWVIYIPLLRKNNIGLFDLLRISIVGNSISHSIIALLILKVQT